jgi:mono/diheme cytochrome c family protein
MILTWLACTGSVVDELQCARCHGEVPGAKALAREQSCTGCHHALHEGAFDHTHRPEAVAQWKQKVVHYLTVPSLGSVQRLQRDWVLSFVQHPVDVRPGLEEQMVPIPLSPEQQSELVQVLGLQQRLEPVPEGDVQRGLQLMAPCQGCHAYRGVWEAVPSGMAPDLRWTRERLAPSVTDAWLVAPEPPMPVPDLDEAERRDVLAALYRAPLRELVPAQVPALPPHPDPVSWEEAQRRVFRRMCWHCHSDPAGNGGDGGPGNTGGFGHPGARAELGTREGLLAGSRSGPLCGTSLLVQVLVERQREVAGLDDPQLLGMPLGLPPLPPEEIALVSAYAAQGCPP